jgi:hypothetical protein
MGDGYGAPVDILRVRSLECGFISADLGTMLEGQLGRDPDAGRAFLVEHPRGTLVFDTGMHPEHEHTTARLGSNASLVEIEQAPGWTLADNRRPAATPRAGWRPVWRDSDSSET